MTDSRFEHHIHVDGVDAPPFYNNIDNINRTLQPVESTFTLGTLRSDNLPTDDESSGSLRHDDLNDDQQAIYERGLRDGIDYSSEASDNSYSEEYSDSGIEMKEGRAELKSVIELLSSKTKKNAQKGKWYKNFDTIVKIIIILGPALTGFMLELDGYDGKIVIYCSFALSILSGVYEIAEFKSKGLIHVQMSKLFRKMLRKARESLLYLQTGDEMYHYARHVEEEIDEIELDLCSDTDKPSRDRRSRDIESGDHNKED